MTGKPRICLIEDDEIMGESLCDRFALEDFDYDWFKNGASALAHLGRSDYAAVVSDIRLPDMDGEHIFREAILRGGTLPPWIFITGYGSIDRAVNLLKLGATDYITKPFDLDALIERLKALSTVPVTTHAVTEIPPRLGISPVMRKIEALLPRLAAQAGTLLITGESGVGKEEVARLIHELDPATAPRQMIALNCASVPESLIEAELFGYEKGAFTGAMRTKPGVFEQADGSTLFLDEIGDMPLVMQAKLLRVIQERVIVRVGGEKPIPIRLRLICATHRDLRQMVERGLFREDLFYRIHVIHLRIPALRERRDDIPWLCRRFLDDFAMQHPDSRKRLSPQAERLLLAHDWPGNIRELKHAIERACILSPGSVLEVEHLFEHTIPAETTTVPGASQKTTLSEYLQSCERQFILQTLQTHHGHLGQTASSLGISRKNLWEKMKKLGISTED